MATLRGKLRKMLNILLGFAGFQLLRAGETGHIKSYQPLRRTLIEAEREGLSVGDYIDRKFQVPGATQATIDQIVGLGLLSPKTQTVCEIGPGSGRYLEKVQRFCAPCSYEIYEPSKEWSDWLGRKYGVTVHNSDGRSLRDTANESVDLIHAHKVFVCLPFVVSCQYFGEMSRVTRLGGHIVFDIVSEGCIDDVTIQKWMSSAIYYPCILPRKFVVDFFAREKCSLHGSFFAPMTGGQSEYLAFVKE